MDDLRKSIHICGSSLRRILANPRLYMAFLWFFMLISELVLAVRSFSVQSDISVSPWILPFLVDKAGSQLIVVIGALLLFCDAPFVSDTTSWQLLRAGRKCWFWGNMLYIFVLSLIYMAGLFLLPNLLLLGRGRWMSNWGQVLGALAQNTQGASDQLGIYPLNYAIMARYTPVRAVFLAMLAIWLNAVLTGVVSYTFNLWVKRGAGTLSALVVGLTPFLNSAVAVSHIGYYISPPSWMDIGAYNLDGYGRNPPLCYVYIVFTMLILGCVLLSYIGVMKKDIHSSAEI